MQRIDPARLSTCWWLVAVMASTCPGEAPKAAPNDRFAADSPAPVVLDGAPLGALRGIDPKLLVAFRYDGQWKQIPVQVDERAVLSYGKAYGGRYRLGRSVMGLIYTDAGTFIGPDPDKTFDRDDEVVFMARDAGPLTAPPNDPRGVVPNSGMRIEIIDPISRTRACVYLFRSAGTLAQDAGKRYVNYDFKLLAGDYLKKYNVTGVRVRRGRLPDILGFGNPEDSTIRTPHYSRHFIDRWISDEFVLKKPLGSGADILDMDKALFAPGVPWRSVITFSVGEGAFVINKSGPVRAIRSYMGSNSGPLTQRVHLFYDRYEVNRTHLRVHPIGGIVCFTDYSEQAVGMTYSNNLNLDGVKVDGLDDAVKTGPLSWEMVTGDQGTLVIVHRWTSNIRKLRPTSYYLDSRRPEVLQITGDRHAFASSGLWIRQHVPNTDPRVPGAKLLTLERLFFIEQANSATALAARRLAEINQPLRTKVSSFRHE